MTDTSDAPLVLLCSVPLEAEPLRAVLEGASEILVGRKAALRGLLEEARVLLLPAGMGKANAAQGLTALLENHPVRGVIGFGVGGAYPGSGLAVGEVALASHEIYGDEGVQAPGGWLSSEEIGIPLLERAELRRFNEFPLDPDRVAAARAALEAEGIAVKTGPFVTVSCCSGTFIRGVEMATRFGAICENMEGAALAHVCALYEVPFLEVRGISNLVEDRDLSAWRLREAVEAAAGAIRILARRYSSLFPLALASGDRTTPSSL